MSRNQPSSTLRAFTSVLEVPRSDTSSAFPNSAPMDEPTIVGGEMQFLKEKSSLLNTYIIVTIL